MRNQVLLTILAILHVKCGMKIDRAWRFEYTSQCKLHKCFKNPESHEIDLDNDYLKTKKIK